VCSAQYLNLYCRKFVSNRNRRLAIRLRCFTSANAKHMHGGRNQLEEFVWNMCHPANALFDSFDIIKVRLPLHFSSRSSRICGASRLRLSNPQNGSHQTSSTQNLPLGHVPLSSLLALQLSLNLTKLLAVLNLNHAIDLRRAT
jgi:hypothetical protein